MYGFAGPVRQLKELIGFQSWLDQWAKRPPKRRNYAKYILPLLAAGGVLGLLAISLIGVPPAAIGMGVVAVGLYAAAFAAIWKGIPVPADDADPR